MLGSSCLVRKQIKQMGNGERGGLSLVRKGARSLSGGIGLVGWGCRESDNEEDEGAVLVLSPEHPCGLQYGVNLVILGEDQDVVSVSNLLKSSKG
jgi:hypothetical protein